jgi:hypothetical protein
MKCPHCLVAVNAQIKILRIDEDENGEWRVRHWRCPGCNKLVMLFDPGYGPPRMFYPVGINRSPVPPEVPTQIAEDYREACKVLPDSAKAAAALSRRCLQTILRSVGKVKPSDLSNEIQEVLDSGKLPSSLAESIDAVRHVGNFSAHPIKSRSTGEIVAVEPEEAEWTLDVIEALFDFYYVQPAVIAKKREALNKKLEEAGKPPLKSSAKSGD